VSDAPKVTVKGVARIPLVARVAVLVTTCEVLTVHTKGFAVAAEIYVPAVTPVPVKNCPIAIVPVVGATVIVSVVVVIDPVNVEVVGTPFVMAMGLPEDPTV